MSCLSWHSYPICCNFYTDMKFVCYIVLADCLNNFGRLFHIFSRPGIPITTSRNGNAFLVTDRFPSQRPGNADFDAFFNVSINKELNKPLSCWWFETPWCSLRRYVMQFLCHILIYKAKEGLHRSAKNIFCCNSVSCYECWSLPLSNIIPLQPLSPRWVFVSLIVDKW